MYSLLPKDNLFKNIFDFTIASGWDCVAAVKRLQCRFDFIVLYDHVFHLGTLKSLEGTSDVFVCMVSWVGL